MATTRSKIDAAALVPKVIVLVEGYQHPFSDASEAQVQAVMVGTDWQGKTIIPNLVIDIDNVQSIHPWNPFTGGGKVKLKVPGGNTPETDVFGIDTARTDDGAESLLTRTADSDDTTIWVEHTDDFPGGSNVDAHVGVECFSYSLVGGGTLIGNGTGFRGKYSPFGAYGSTRFARHHRVTTADNGVRLAPLVTQQPRTWAGRRVGVWLHHEESGVLNSMAEALCVFSGFISEPVDTEDGWTEVLCEHEHDDVKDFLCGRDMYEATLAGGHFLKAGLVFSFQDENGTTIKNATDLTVVASGAVGLNQVNAGAYLLEEIQSIINGWLTAELVAGRIHGNYTMICPEDVAGVPKTVWHWYIPGTGAVVQFHVTWPTLAIAKALGYSNTNYWSSGTPNAGHSDGGSPHSPKMANYLYSAGGAAFDAYLEDECGTFQDNYATLPAAVKTLLPSNASSYEWGLFLLSGNVTALMVARIVRSSGSVLLTNGIAVDSPIAPGLAAYADLQGMVATPVEIGEAPPRIRQIFVHEGTCATLLKQFFCSTGTRGYNHPTYDVLGNGTGLARPWGILSQTFLDSCDLLPGADDVLMVVIDKPTKFIELFKADLVLRLAHLTWRDQTLRFATWPTPSAALAAVTLTESVKAEQVGVKASHRAPSVLDRTWVVNTIKLNYNRDASKIVEGGASVFLSPPIFLEDGTSVDDVGGKPFTLDCRNTYGDAEAQGQGIRALASKLLAFLPYFSRPVWKTSRSAALIHYEQLGVGDTVLVTDPFVRDKTTGQRGTTARPAVIVRHQYSLKGPSGSDPTSKTKMSGQLEVVFFGNDRTFAYAPCAEVDYTAANGGYDAGTHELTCEAHAHSDILESVDASHFTDGVPSSPRFQIKIIEVDPADPTAPLSWDTEVDYVSGNLIAVDPPLAGWNSAKRYRVIFDSYADTVAAQRSKAFQAGSNGKIANLRTAHQYGANDFQINDWVNGRRPGKSAAPYHMTIPELPANLSYGPNTGAPRDTGYDKEATLLLENLMDHKTARSFGFLDTEVRSNTDYDGYKLLFCRPIFLGLSLLGNGLNRYAYIRPLWRAAADSPAGIPVSLRVSISGRVPTGTSLNAVTIKAPAVGNIWNTVSTATDWVISDELAFPLGNFNQFQYGFLLIEGTKYAECRGCPQGVERERVDQ